MVGIGYVWDAVLKMLSNHFGGDCFGGCGVG
jgi:hypothetical protein